ncbi:MAG: ABC transporter ATP-binding protein [Erysipelotrichaceae bacterium]|nr:ABC transporter ATP-binding protein [Erysipelotrichaceae bacterium]
MIDLIRKFKIVFSHIKQFKKYAIITPILMIGEAGAECAIPFIMSLLVSTIEEGKGTVDMGTIWMYAGILIGLTIFSIICGVLGGIFAAKASTGLARNLRHALYAKVQDFSFANIDHFSASSLVTRMTTDINNAVMAFSMVIRIVVRAPLMIIFSAVMAFISGGAIAWIFIGIMPIVMFGLILLMIKAMPIFRRVFKRYDALNQSVKENVEGIRVVKSFVREDYEKEKFAKASNSIAGEFIKAEKILAFSNPIMNTSIHLSNILVLAIGSYFILENVPVGGIGNISVATLSACITYGVQILAGLMMVSMIIVMMAMSIESMNRIGQVLEEKSTIVNCENPVYEMKNGDVEFKNVNFRYSEEAENNAVSNINIKIKSGQFVGIIGSTGSGKTSLVNLICRLYDVSEGEVLVGDTNVKEYDLETLRNNVAVVLQKNVLFSGTIKDNLRWGDENATDEEMIHACKIAQAHEFIEKFPQGYDTYIEQGGTNVSGGQKQRLCIARALLKKPKVLILDDSTSAVDTKTDAIIRKNLKEIVPDTTKIVIAQRISSIETADQIIVMDNGQINAIGTHDSLLKNNEIYREVYYSQNRKGGEQ